MALALIGAPMAALAQSAPPRSQTRPANDNSDLAASTRYVDTTAQTLLNAMGRYQGGKFISQPDRIELQGSNSTGPIDGMTVGGTPLSAAIVGKAPLGSPTFTGIVAMPGLDVKNGSITNIGTAGVGVGNVSAGVYLDSNNTALRPPSPTGTVFIQGSGQTWVFFNPGGMGVTGDVSASGTVASARLQVIKGGATIVGIGPLTGSPSYTGVSVNATPAGADMAGILGSQSDPNPYVNGKTGIQFQIANIGVASVNASGLSVAGALTGSRLALSWAGSTGDALGITAASPAGVQRSLSARADDCVNVKDRGAVADLVVDSNNYVSGIDNKDKFQEAISRAFNLRKDVCVPEGAYYLSGSITVDTSAATMENSVRPSIRGAGRGTTWLRFSVGTYSALSYKNGTSGAGPHTYATISGLRIDKVDVQGIGLDLQATAFLNVDDVSVLGFDKGILGTDVLSLRGQRVSPLRRCGRRDKCRFGAGFLTDESHG